MEQDLSYYYNPQTDDDFMKIALDVYGSSVRDNSKSQLIELGKMYHITGEE
jgi:hypothetical protein